MQLLWHGGGGRCAYGYLWLWMKIHGGNGGELSEGKGDIVTNICLYRNNYYLCVTKIVTNENKNFKLSLL